MPLLKTKHQPYFPDPDSPANFECTDKEYCHPLTPDDLIRTQFYQTPCAGSQVTDPLFEDTTFGGDLITNGTFAANATGWETTYSNPLDADGWSWDAGGFIKRSAGGVGAGVGQLSIGVATNDFVRITFDLETSTDATVNVYLGFGNPCNLIGQVTGTGSHTLYGYFCGTMGVDDDIWFQPLLTADVITKLDNVTVKVVTFTNWDANNGWLITDGYACHIDGETGILTETIANYLLATEYWKVSVTATGVTTGTCDVYLSDTLAGTITASGDFTYYGVPTVDGVLSFDPSSDFDGCISSPATYKLRSDYLVSLVKADGSDSFNISAWVSYYHEFVTLNYPVASEDRDYGCYKLEIVDSCITSGDDIMIHGTFANSGEGWSKWADAYQIDFSGDQALLIFDPLTGLVNQISNGDFGTGDFTGWTAGANWSVVGNKARHTAGSTAALSQSVTINSGMPQHWYQITVSNRTAGSITISFGSFTSTTYSFNGVITYGVLGLTAGSATFTITPSSDFDGDIDDCFFQGNPDLWTPYVSAVCDPNAAIIEANYELTYDIIATDDPVNISVGGSIQGHPNQLDYQSTVGTHVTSLPSYTPGSQKVYFTARFLNPAATGYQCVYPGSVTIDTIELRAVEPFEATYISECLNYQESHQRTKVLTAYCDQNAFGFEFENTGFKLMQRALVRTVAPFYPKEKQVAKYGTGDASVVYAATEKYWQMHTDYASETFHDALSIMVDCDHFHIGDNEEATEYIAEVDDYNPSWQDAGRFPLAPAVINIRTKEAGQKFNRHT